MSTNNSKIVISLDPSEVEQFNKVNVTLTRCNLIRN